MSYELTQALARLREGFINNDRPQIDEAYTELLQLTQGDLKLLAAALQGGQE